MVQILSESPLRTFGTGPHNERLCHMEGSLRLAPLTESAHTILSDRVGSSHCLAARAVREYAQGVPTERFSRLVFQTVLSLSPHGFPQACPGNVICHLVPTR